MGLHLSKLHDPQESHHHGHGSFRDKLKMIHNVVLMSMAFQVRFLNIAHILIQYTLSDRFIKVILASLKPDEDTENSPIYVQALGRSNDQRRYNLTYI